MVRQDLIRMVHADCSVTVGTNAYSVPWRLIDERVRVYHDRDVVVEHDEHHGRSRIGRTCGEGSTASGNEADVRRGGAEQRESREVGALAPGTGAAPRGPG